MRSQWINAALPKAWRRPCACALMSVLLASCGNEQGWGMTDALRPAAGFKEGNTVLALKGAGEEPASGSKRSGKAKAPADAAKEQEKEKTPTPYGQNPSDYILTFSEEFDRFDPDVWNDHIWYEKSNPTKNYAVENGMLKIWPQRDATGKFFNRALDTDRKFYQKYGYFEMEAKLPRGKGVWPAFWLFNHIGDRRPEIDIMEAYPSGDGWGFKDKAGVARPDTYASTVWVGDVEGNQAGFRMHHIGKDLSAGFHKYAVKWEPNKQTFYFDGKQVLVVNVSMADPKYIILDLWFGGASGLPDDSTPQGKSNSFEVNYVRAWQFRE